MSAETAAPEVVEVLGRVSLFQGLPRSDLEAIAGLAKPRTAAAGEFIFREGDPGDRLYLVEEGAVEVLKERPLGDHERLGVRRGGEAFGEFSLLEDAPRAASVRALEDARLLSVTREDFDALLGGDSLPVRLLRGMAAPLRALDARYREVESGGETDALQRFTSLVLHGLEPRTTPRVEGYRLAGATVRDDTLVGGSIWDGFMRPDGRALLAVLDVKGSGLPPAYLLAITRALLREVGRTADFRRIMGRLNAATSAHLFEGLDECIEAALMEVGPEGVRWSCAGDQPAVVLRRDGEAEDVTAQGPPLGIVPSFEYGVSELALEPGDTLLAFSEAPAALVRGAVDFARTRRDAEPLELARSLQTALATVPAAGGERDLAFVVIRRS